MIGFQVIPHWLETCQREGIKWMLWLAARHTSFFYAIWKTVAAKDSDTILVGQHASLDFVADADPRVMSCGAHVGVSQRHTRFAL